MTGRPTVRVNSGRFKTWPPLSSAGDPDGDGHHLPVRPALGHPVAADRHAGRPARRLAPPAGHRPRRGRPRRRPQPGWQFNRNIFGLGFSLKN